MLGPWIEFLISTQHFTTLASYLRPSIRSSGLAIVPVSTLRKVPNNHVENPQSAAVRRETDQEWDGVLCRKGRHRTGVALPLGRQAPRSPRPPADDRRSALLVVAVDLDRLPYAVDMIRIALRESVHRGAVLGVDDEDR